MTYIKHKFIGGLLMLPAIVVILYLIFTPSAWLYAILNIVTTGLAMWGLHVFKGYNTTAALIQTFKELRDKECQGK